MSANRINIAIDALVDFAKKNNLLAIETLIKQDIKKEFYLDQLCEIAKPGSTSNSHLYNIVEDELEENENISEQVRACIKILSLDEEKDPNVVKKEDIIYIEENLGAGLEEN